jgi:hypothetical protein
VLDAAFARLSGKVPASAAAPAIAAALVTNRRRDSCGLNENMRLLGMVVFFS